MKEKQISKKYLWEKFVSPYIRKRDLNFQGYGNCISCGERITYETCDAGHFIPKSKGKYFYWLEENIHAQCPNCNRFGSNDTGANYYKNLCKKIGKEKTDKLLSIKNKNPKDNRTLNEIKAYYKEKLELCTPTLDK